MKPSASSSCQAPAGRRSAPLMRLPPLPARSRTAARPPGASRGRVEITSRAAPLAGAATPLRRGACTARVHAPDSSQYRALDPEDPRGALPVSQPGPAPSGRGPGNSKSRPPPGGADRNPIRTDRPTAKLGASRSARYTAGVAAKRHGDLVVVAVVLSPCRRRRSGLVLVVVVVVLVLVVVVVVLVVVLVVAVVVLLVVVAVVVLLVVVLVVAVVVLLVVVAVVALLVVVLASSPSLCFLSSSPWCSRRRRRRRSASCRRRRRSASCRRRPCRRDASCRRRPGRRASCRGRRPCRRDACRDHGPCRRGPCPCRRGRPCRIPCASCTRCSAPRSTSCTCRRACPRTSPSRTSRTSRRSLCRLQCWQQAATRIQRPRARRQDNGSCKPCAHVDSSPLGRRGTGDYARERCLRSTPTVAGATADAPQTGRTINNPFVLSKG